MVPTGSAVVQFQSVIVLSPFGDGEFWYLQEDLYFHPQKSLLEVVPKGFVTDFASIPAILSPVLPNWQRYGPAAIVHDYLYWSQHVSRAIADDYLRQGMVDMDVDPVRERVIYWTLRAVGGFAWHSNYKKRLAGERKCMAKKFPTDPAQKWSEWKTDNPDSLH